MRSHGVVGLGRRTVALAVGVALVAVGSAFAPVAGATSEAGLAAGATTGWQRVGPDHVVRVQGATARGSVGAAAAHNAEGYVLTDYGAELSWAFPGYRIRLVGGPAVEGLRPAVTAAAARISAVNGQVLEVAAGRVNQFEAGDEDGDGSADTLNDPAAGEIFVALDSSTSPCGDDGFVIGCGGPNIAPTQAGKNVAYAGYVWIYPDFAASASSDEIAATIRHELGHVQGLEHFSGTYLGQHQLMYPSAEPGLYDYRAGDENGLRALRAPDGDYVKAAYNDFLGRAPDAAGIGYWFTVVSFPRSLGGRFGFVRQLTASDEWLGAVVDRLYQSTLGRGADADGKAFWIERLRAGVPVPTVAASFYSGPEYFERAGGTAPDWVSDLYAELLGRTADGSGRDYWVLQSESVGRQAVALDFYQSYESRMKRVADLYGVLLHRAPDPEGQDYWAGRVLREGDLALAASLASSDEYWLRAQPH